jgi:hypothetical protein
MPYDVPAERVDQVLEAVEFYNTYYAKYPLHRPDPWKIK